LHLEQLETRCVPAYITLGSFDPNIGQYPTAGLVIDGNGNLFGVAPGGGLSGFGTVFEVVHGTNALIDYADFDGVSNGDGPTSDLLIDSSGNLYGTTSGFLAQDAGNVFTIKAGSSHITVLATFNGTTNGTTPLGGLARDASGNLYGTTSGVDSISQQPTSNGTVFEVTPGTGTITTLANFNGTNGGNPVADLIIDSAGNLFGTAAGGGIGYSHIGTGYGTIFEVQQGTSAITRLASFDLTTTGVSPNAGLVMDSSGNLYGTCVLGGAYATSGLGYGTVYELPHGSSTATALASFDGTATGGSYPTAGLILDSSGNLYGTTSGLDPSTGVAATNGTVFELKAGSNAVTTLAVLPGAPDGANPFGGLVMDAAGNLYGTTLYGGSQDNGVVFKVTPSSSSSSPTITTTSLSNWTVNKAGYGQTISATGGSGSLTFSSTGTLPSGLTLSSGGVLTGTPTTAGSYSFTVTATDTASNTGSQAYTVVINPPVTLPATLASAAAGVAYNQTITASGGTGTVTFGETGALPSGLSLSSAGVLSGTTTTTGSFPITVTATDAVGASASQAYTLTVSPGAAFAYLVTVQGSSPFAAGTGFLVAVQAVDQYGNPITSYGGPPTATATISPSSAKSNFPVTVAIGSNGTGLFLANLQKVGSYTITVAGGSLTGMTGPVTIAAGPAVALAFAQQPVSTPTGNVLPPVTVQVQDLYGNVVTSDNSDSVKVGVASGPPGAPGFTAGSTTTATVASGVATFNNLTLTTVGIYSLSALVPNRYTGPNSAAFNTTPLQVLPGSFASSPSGFSVTFNAPFLVNSVTPALYGKGFGAHATVTPTVTLTGPAGPVEGSVIVNAAHNTLTFVQTDTASLVNNGTPILPDGSYTATIIAEGPQGLQAAGSGGYLDGTSAGTPGHDWTTTFTISAASDDVLWVPATADGPGQPLNAPGANQAGGGYPIYLKDSTGTVTNVQLTLNYDPTLLTVSGVQGTGFSLLPASIPGAAVLQYSGAALPAGTPNPIGYLLASVPAGTAASPMPYKAKNLLHLSGVSLNSGTIPVATSDALHVVAYVGDASGDGIYSSDDAVSITHVGLQTDSGFPAYPLVDPVILADTDGAGFVPADAALQVNEAGVNLPTANLPNPAIPSGVVFLPISNNVDPSLTLGENLQIAADGTLTVPVNLDDPAPAGSTGLIEAHLALAYDPRQFTVSAADIHLGTVLAGGSGWSVVSTINAVTGQIALVLTSDTPITSTSGGSLVTIDFHQNGALGRIANPSSIALVSSVNPTGQQVILTELSDAQGSFVLTPAPASGLGSFLPRPAYLNDNRAPETAALSDTSSPAFPVARTDQVIDEALNAPAVPGAVQASGSPSAASLQRAESIASPDVSLLPAMQVLLPSPFSSIWTPSTAADGVLEFLADPLFQALARAGQNLFDPRSRVDDLLPDIGPADAAWFSSSGDDLNGHEWLDQYFAHDLD
jgi:uncharacterized repeat protein (TIGR03803 family)